ncbi:MAG: hypothetical protein GY953_05440 [bacterium]|nr:hypothetical protein [bacterium]
MLGQLNPKGSFGLVFVVIAMGAFMWWVPVTRIFFPLALAVGVVIAGGLYLWRRSHPIEHPPNVDPGSQLKLTDDD